MKVAVVGGSGTIGTAIVRELKPRHDVISIGANNGDVKVDITDRASIEAMYQQLDGLDAIISAVGKVHFGLLNEMTEENLALGLQNKLMGQVNLVLIGLNYLNDNGSFTLTSGLLNHDPIKFGSSAAMVNGALEGFVVGAQIEMPRGLRINLVSPTVITEAMPAYEDFFRGYVPVDAKIAAKAYAKSVEGLQTGKVIRVGW